MEPFQSVIRQMIPITDEEMNAFLQDLTLRTYTKKALISRPGKVPDELFFILKGIIRVIVTDHDGVEHTVHFALENQFIADYSSFIQQLPAIYTLQALENTEVVVLPRSSIEWGYKNLQFGDRLGRLVAEFYFIYQDNRIKNTYARTPKARYENIDQVFPNLHNRVPQHMIASYLGITPIHLSRLKSVKKEHRSKI